ncbi:MAG: chloride channel protein [Betaproteobacteria bacterium]|nr:chloride channel protein [Betaproteobacteria bacterium]
MSIAIGLTAAIVAQGLLRLIGVITHLSFFGSVGWTLVDPAQNRLGPWVILIPVAGGLIVGLMARYGSPAIRGHGIPEAMEQILANRSRIPPRVLLLKPLSAAISIGTGGPFGAEGPIIATGGALGSVIGQWIQITANERKILLSAGAAAGMTAIFGTPLAALLLAIELLLFEFRPASLLPVLAACATAAVMRGAFEGFHPFFAMPALGWPAAQELLAYIPLGALIGFAAVLITRSVYAVEDLFGHLPVHWMWWPAIGAVGVGLIGWWVPASLGVGYGNIDGALAGTLMGSTLLLLCIAKLLSWTIALGSGTSGGTLAPLMTVGACLGAMLGHACHAVCPQLGLNANLAALVGMAAIFAGASRALFLSVLFALETTWQISALVPLLIGCGSAYLTSSLLMRQTIMTEKIARRGVHVPNDYQADSFAQARVRDHASDTVVALAATQSVGDVRNWLDGADPGSKHQGYPVIDDGNNVIGVVTRKDIFTPRTSGRQLLAEIVRGRPITISSDATLAEAMRLMATWRIGRLPVLAADGSGRLTGMLTRSDLLSAYRVHLSEHLELGA